MFASEECDRLIDAIDASIARIGREHRELLSLIARIDPLEVWKDWGARDTAHWLAIRYGISEWKARRWIAAAHALEGLPELSAALEGGELGIDKVVELCRFATPEIETRLIAWAQKVSCAAVRQRADREVACPIQEVRDAIASRSYAGWYYDEGRRYGFRGDVPAADGAFVERALRRRAERIQVLPGEEGAAFDDARMADALVALASEAIAADPDPDRATVVIHTQTDAEGRPRAAEIDGGPAIHPETAARLLCTSRTQEVVEDAAGDVVGVGRMSREPSAWMVRQIRHRDRECRFPGCGARRFTEAHHVVWWRHGGRTELSNLVLICSFHHRLVHELGWRIRREADGQVEWFLPDGRRYRAGPSPGLDAHPPDVLVAVG
jgi:hypothetical protein